MLKLWPQKLYHAQNMSHLDYFHRLFPTRTTAWSCYSYTQDRRLNYYETYYSIYL